MHRQLAYAARACSGLAPAHISRLIQARRIATSAEGISGVMVYTGEDFFELLEGRDAAIARVAGTLREEPSFRDLRVLLDRSAPTRWYRRWSAGYVSARAFDPWLAGVEAACRHEPPVDAIKRFLDAARTF